MKNIYVMSDIHGLYEPFQTMINQINLLKKDHVYILGDAIDRGPDSIKVLQYIMRHPQISMIKGNHEVMMLEYLNNNSTVDKEIALSLWAQNGGAQTIKDYNSLPSWSQKKMHNYLQSIPNYVIFGPYILVHAGIECCYPHKENVQHFMDRQKEDDLHWIRSSFFSFSAIPNHTVIFGHTPTDRLYKKINREEITPMRIWFDPIHQDKIGIDCGGYFGESFGGRIGCLRLNDMQIFYV